VLEATRSPPGASGRPREPWDIAGGAGALSKTRDIGSDSGGSGVAQGSREGSEALGG